MMEVAFEEARAGLAEGGVPIGAALFTTDGVLLGRGRNRRVQQGDPSLHAEVDAFRAAGRQRDYRSTIMVTTLTPCWYCSGLVRQFDIGAVLIGESETLSGGHEWLAETRGHGHGAERPALHGNDVGLHRGAPRLVARRHRGALVRKPETR
jgi:cytosine/creatinine deaminase